MCVQVLCEPVSTVSFTQFSPHALDHPCAKCGRLLKRTLMCPQCDSSTPYLEVHLKTMFSGILKKHRWPFNSDINQIYDTKKSIGVNCKIDDG